MSTDIVHGDASYTPENIKTLVNADHIRHRPGMYIGNTDAEGMHHLVWEVVYNSVDEALAGYCKNITIVVHVDNSITIADDGRGIPVGTKAETGRSTLEEVLTIAGSSGKFDNDAYKTSAGLHGMGAKAMNALSEWCEAEVRRDGRVFKMEFARGKAASALQDLGPAPPGQSGTTITFKPDPEKFGDIPFSYEKLAARFQQIAYLNKRLRVSIRDERDGRADTYYSEAGITDYVQFLNTGETVGHPPIYINKMVDGITIEVCLQYTTGDERRELCFANNAYNKDGGTHQSGLRTGITRSVTAYGKKEGHFKDGLELKGEDFRDGLTAVVSVSHPTPKFESQTKVKLVSGEVEAIAAGVVNEALADYFERNPKDGAWIAKKVALAAEARIAAKKARDAVKDRKNILGGGGLPGKLMDCTTRERDKSELFLVEGDSAGGSAESGRARFYQAVLPLRGKVLNVERARLEKLLANAEIAALIGAVGVDIGNTDDIAKVRYGKIIILTDADVDGQHIRTLLLTFFFRQMRKLIEAGHIYVARPPLFKVTQKKEVRFVQTREAMAKELFARGLKEATLHVLATDARSGPGFPRELSADALGQLIPVLDEIEHAVVVLERRGHTFASFVPRRTTAGPERLREGAGAGQGGFPVFHVRLGGKEFFFHTQADVDAFRAAESARLGRELVLSDDALVGTSGTAPTADGSVAPATVPAAAPVDEKFRFTVDEWHEVRALNRGVAKLLEAGFEPSDLLPLPRVAGREPAVRFQLAFGETRKDLDHLRQLIAEIRRLGERGLTVTRFKGLGEMDPEELWDTTLDPARRTLLQVTMNDAIAAENMFRKLMGDEVEGRRRFIFDHRINVDAGEIDYGA